MFALLSIIAAFVAFDLLALRYGADSRRDERNL
jgi:hypothetical protein